MERLDLVSVLLVTGTIGVGKTAVLQAADSLPIEAGALVSLDPKTGAITAAKLLAEIGPISRFKSEAQSRATAASHRSKQAQVVCSATGSTAAATDN